MEKDFITLNSGKVNDYLHHIDAKAYGTRRMLSVFLAEFEDDSILFDCGSSLDIKRILRYFKKNNIPLSSFKYIVPSHHHFDHIGGVWKLYEELKKHNPEVKILTNRIMKELLNDFELHLKRGARTYGDLTGIMKPIEESAFQIIKPTIKFDSNTNNLDIISTFHINGSEVNLIIFKTPGHTPDHQCPAFVKDGQLNFIHFGEAVGTIYHSSKLVTLPTSMPIYYNHEKYMETLNNIKNLIPLKAGFGHFGIVKGKENVRELILDNESFMKKFRKNIIKYYQEKPETKYILKKMKPLLTPRTDLSMDDSPVFNGIFLAVVYGEMITLGYREIPKDELVYYNKYYSL
jgi:glyoxylase-like metal-dependent hydrolase (beta-lactamase superfamily II)